mmetsp:Transcript_5448/g.13688  ORF Transcript_5448/g.13688 Transcript_5448/m.13688 type:complete len:406 (+) Transcript_5448:144-1361(+)
MTRGINAPRRRQRRWNQYFLVCIVVVYLYKSSIYNSHLATKFEVISDVVELPAGGSSTLGDQRSRMLPSIKINDNNNNNKNKNNEINDKINNHVAEATDPCGGSGTNASTVGGDGGGSSSNNNNGIVGESVYQQWKYIDETIQRDFPKERVSGGIFLYPRQSAILTHLVRKVHEGIVNGDGGGDRALTICETGYGSGHSMVLFQEASVSLGPVRVVSFDKFDRPYQLPIWHHLNNGTATTTTRDQQQRQHRFFAGNSCVTVPRELRSVSCDFLHGSSLCPTDNIDLVEHSPCGVLLTSTAMGSLGDRAVYFGKRAQWRKLRDRGCITGIVCYREDGTPLERDFIFAKKGEKRTDEFCVAVTTGRCQRGLPDSGTMSGACRARVDEVLSRLALDRMCPAHRIPTPA